MSGNKINEDWEASGVQNERQGVSTPTVTADGMC